MNPSGSSSVDEVVLQVMPSWLNEPEKYPIIYGLLIEEGRKPKVPIPLVAVTKLLWASWQKEDWFPRNAEILKEDSVQYKEIKPGTENEALQ